MDDGSIDRLKSEAQRAAAHAYAPYSSFRVGAAILATSGKVFCGSNVENRSYGLTNCAERSAIFSAVSAGETSFVALAVFSPDSAGPLPPCGACRQVISEFVDQDFPVYYGGKDGRYVRVSVAELLPHDSLHDLSSRMRPDR